MISGEGALNGKSNGDPRRIRKESIIVCSFILEGSKVESSRMGI